MERIKQEKKERGKNRGKGRWVEMYRKVNERRERGCLDERAVKKGKPEEMTKEKGR